MGGTRSGRWPHAMAALALTALAVGFWIYRIYVLAPSRMGLLSADLFQYFYPSTVFLHEELRAARLPTWNPYQMAGYPFLAAQITGALYPPLLFLAALLTPARALEAHAVSHLVAAGFFTWLFARRIGLGLWPSLASAVALMLSTEMVSRTYNTAYLSTATWLPALFWATHGLLRESRPRWAVAVAVVAALSFLGGNTQGAVYSAQAAAAFWAIGLWVLTPPHRRLRTVGLTVGSVFLALALIAPQLLPTVELAREGTRGLPGLGSKDASFGSISVEDLLYGALGWPRGNFVTPVALALAPFGILDRERRWAWIFFLIAAALVGLFMLGPVTAVWRIYYALPLGNLFRMPARAGAVWTFCLCVLAGLGIQGLTSRADRWWPNAPAISTWIGALLALSIAGDSFARSRMPESIPALWVKDVAPDGIAGFLDTRRGYDRTFVEDLHRYTVQETQAKLGTVHRRFVVPDYEPLMPRAYAEFFGQDELWHGRLNLHPSATDSGPPPSLARLLDLMGVRHYLAPTGSDRLVNWIFARQLDLAPQRRGGIWIARRNKALPRVYAVGRAQVASNSDDARRLLLAPGFDPSREAIVSKGSGLDGDPDRVRTASIRSYAHDEVVIDASCEAPCLLVLSDLHYPGWVAWVDDRPAEIVPTNIVFRGLLLDPGVHRVVYRFRPRSFWLGLAIAAAGIVTTIGIAVRRTVRRHRGAGITRRTAVNASHRMRACPRRSRRSPAPRCAAA